MKSPYIEEPIAYKNPKSKQFINLSPLFIALYELPDDQALQNLPRGIGEMLDDAIEFFVQPEMAEVLEKSSEQYLRYQNLLIKLRNMFNSMQMNS